MRVFRLAFGKRPAEELYDLRTDPHCITNLAGDPAMSTLRKELAAKLHTELIAAGDPRALGAGGVFDSYEYATDAPHSWAPHSWTHLAGAWQPQDY